MSFELHGFVPTFRRGATLEETLRRLFEQTLPPRRILVVDNAAEGETRRMVAGLAESRLEYVAMPSNGGPAGAAAYAIGRLADEGCPWIYWGDDDDPPMVDDTLERLAALAERHRGDDVGAVAAAGVRWNWRTGEVDRLPNDDLRGDLDMDAAGGNQQLVLHRRVPDRIGIPDARLFFGYEEIEYCLRTRRAGLRLLIDGALAFECRLLAGHLERVFQRDPLRRHSPDTLWRRYYVTRNYVYLMARRFDRPDLARRESAKALLRAVVSCRYGGRYALAMSRFQIRGVVDGWRGNLGVTVEPGASSGRYRSRKEQPPRGLHLDSLDGSSAPAASSVGVRPASSGAGRPSLGVFVVTYRRPAALRASLEALLQQTLRPDLVLVVDNGGSAETREICAAFGERVRYEATGANLGSAGGTAYGTRRLFELGFDLIASGDDDNPPCTADTLERIVGLLDRADVAVAGAGAVGTRWDWQSGRVLRLPNEILTGGPLEVDFIGGDQVLTLRRSAVALGGAPDPSLFFGYPDLEHCLRLRRTGWRLLIDSELMLQYRERFGRIEYEHRRSAVPRRPASAAWRYYYTTRNYVFMMSRTFGRPDLALRETGRAMARCAGSWARGPRYGALATSYLLRGVVDGWRGKRGCVVLARSKPGHAPALRSELTATG